MLRTIHKRRGFTLTEIAIVLGVIGMIIGAIWQAAASAYLNWKVDDILQNIVAFQNQSRLQFQSASVAAANTENNTMDDSCGASPPCATAIFIADGTFEPGFINSTLVSGSAFGLSQLYNTKYNYPIWTGIENADLYIDQDGGCGASPLPPCSAANTVIELDLLQMPTEVCIRLMIAIVNSHVDNLVDITGPSEGWGPIEGGSYYGNPTLPTTLTLAQATQACSIGSDPYSYVDPTSSYIWMWFNNQ
jgi:prepilin-type N-terminal cleavage/methylation domain-containing protein